MYLKKRRLQDMQVLHFILYVYISIKHTMRWLDNIVFNILVLYYYTQYNSFQ